MRRIMTMAVLATAAIYAQADEGLTWLQKVYDFGAFDEDTKEKKAEFRFVNTGTEDVAIISAAATCGCTTPHYSTDAIAPGDTAVISVSYDPSGRPGRFEKNVYVRTSASPERVKLTLRGAVIGNAESVRARYPVDMGAVKLRNGAVMMGRVYAGHAKVEYADGYNQSADTVAVQVISAPDYIDVRVIPELVPAGEQMMMDVTFHAERCPQWGIVTDSIMLTTGGQQVYSLPVVAIIQEDFSQLTSEQRARAPRSVLSADRVNLGTIAAGATDAVTGHATITNQGHEPLLIRRAYSQDPGVSAVVSADTVAPGKSADIAVTFAPGAQPEGIINARVTIITNDPDNPMQILRVVADRN